MCILGDVTAHANPSRPVVEGGENAHLGEAAEKCKNTSLGTTLRGGCAAGTAADRFTCTKEPSVGPATAAGGGVHTGECTET